MKNIIENIAWLLIFIIQPTLWSSKILINDEISNNTYNEKWLLTTSFILLLASPLYLIYSTYKWKSITAVVTIYTAIILTTGFFGIKTLEKDSHQTSCEFLYFFDAFIIIYTIHFPMLIAFLIHILIDSREKNVENNKV